MKRKLIFGIAALAVTAGAVIAGVTMTGAPAPGDSVEDFYRGKTIELIVGYSAGGGYDRYARTLARHMGKHIPGNPVIVVKNMPGAGSLVAANHLFVAAPKDGAVFGTFNRTIPTEPLLASNEGIDFKATKFNWIGSLNNEVSVCVSWHTSAVKTLKDLSSAELTVGAAGNQQSGSYRYSQFLNNIFGAKIKVVTGYPGSSELLLAMERSEVEGNCSWSWSNAKSKKPDWIRDRKVNILMQMALRKHPDLPDVPLIMDLAKTEEQRQMLTLLFSAQTMGRPFAAPPGVPEERVQALRDAFQATTKDPEFLAEAKKGKLEINPVSGKEIDELLRAVYATPENVIAMTREAIKG